jgi:hypothetical protein
VLAETGQSSQAFSVTTCSSGFTGEFCDSCENGYYKTGAGCRSCGLEDEEKQKLVYVSMALVCWFVLLAVGISVLGPAKLAAFTRVRK